MNPRPRAPVADVERLLLWTLRYVPPRAGHWTKTNLQAYTTACLAGGPPRAVGLRAHIKARERVAAALVPLLAAGVVHRSKAFPYPVTAEIP